MKPVKLFLGNFYLGILRLLRSFLRISRRGGTDMHLGTLIDANQKNGVFPRRLNLGGCETAALDLDSWQVFAPL